MTTTISWRRKVQDADPDHAYKARYPVAYEFGKRRFHDDIVPGQLYRGAPSRTIWDDGMTLWDDKDTTWPS